MYEMPTCSSSAIERGAGIEQRRVLMYGQEFPARQGRKTSNCRSVWQSGLAFIEQGEQSGMDCVNGAVGHLYGQMRLRSSDEEATSPRSSREWAS